MRASGYLIVVGRHSHGATYSLLCDAAGRTRRLTAGSDSALTDRGLSLTHTPGCPWLDAAGHPAPIPNLDVCLDIDLTASAFTASLAIRRLGLHRRMGEETVQVAQIGVPDLTVTPVPHHFRTIDFGDNGATIAHAGPSGEHQLTVDRHGFVLDVPRRSYRLR